eukprot:TRINITY_DN2484_c0_g1_i4.p1 TRINITY_DN2484_c0_g1~~TRINITY_DN2484_c0_g1_i4.p1  ORF type:complete len:113 (+),score=26.67 TRINITY_DN2484_c0_g1_i4:532-870(+)
MDTSNNINPNENTHISPNILQTRQENTNIEPLEISNQTATTSTKNTDSSILHTNKHTDDPMEIKEDNRDDIANTLIKDNTNQTPMEISTQNIQTPQNDNKQTTPIYNHDKAD